ncbi:MAG: tetratricopeptide repeat protein [Woeseia sp.]
MRPQDIGNIVIPADVGVYIPPQVRSYSIDCASITFDVGPTVAAAVNDQLLRSFQSVSLLALFPPAPGNLDIVIVPQPTFNCTVGIISVTENLALDFYIYSPDGELLRTLSESGSADISMFDLDPVQNIEAATDAMRTLSRSAVVEFVHDLGSDRSLYSSVPLRAPATINLSAVSAKAAEMERRGDLNGALAVYTNALQEFAPSSFGPVAQLVNDAIDLSLKIAPNLPVPETAMTHGVNAQEAVQQATATDDFERARREFRMALALAPWWGNAWVNLSILDEQLGDPYAARLALEHYIRATPQAPDIAAIQEKIGILRAMPPPQ